MPPMAQESLLQVDEPFLYLSLLYEIESDTASRNALKMLCELSRNARATNAELEAATGSHIKQLQRWKRLYRSGGLPELLNRDRETLPPPVQLISEKGGNISFEEFLRFTNSLKLESDLQKLIAMVREGLEELLVDVDAISVGPNLRCDTVNPQHYHPEFFLHQDAVREDRPVQVDKYFSPQKELQELIATLRYDHFPPSEYHAPYAYIYLLNKVAPVGYLMLWIRQDRGGLGLEILEFMERIKPFITYIFTSLVSHFNTAAPHKAMFIRNFEAFASRARLTLREQQALVHLLQGKTYMEAAELLYCTQEAVKSRVARIYRKSGTKNLGQIYKLLMTPFLETMSEMLARQEAQERGVD